MSTPKLPQLSDAQRAELLSSSSTSWALERLLFVNYNIRLDLKSVVKGGMR